MQMRKERSANAEGKATTTTSTLPPFSITGDFRATGAQARRKGRCSRDGHQTKSNTICEKSTRDTRLLFPRSIQRFNSCFVPSKTRSARGRIRAARSYSRSQRETILLHRCRARVERSFSRPQRKSYRIGTEANTPSPRYRNRC